MRLAITTTINGRERELLVKPNQTLLEHLRDEMGLRGAVEGCGVGVCGSCTVLIDGRPVKLLPDAGDQRRGAAGDDHRGAGRGG